MHVRSKMHAEIGDCEAGTDSSGSESANRETLEAGRLTKPA
jgi:hypothetical protein